MGVRFVVTAFGSLLSLTKQFGQSASVSVANNKRQLLNHDQVIHTMEYYHAALQISTYHNQQLVQLSFALSGHSELLCMYTSQNQQPSGHLLHWLAVFGS